MPVSGLEAGFSVSIFYQNGKIVAAVAVLGLFFFGLLVLVVCLLLAQKKKKIFLQLLKWISLHKNNIMLRWHFRVQSSNLDKSFLLHFLLAPSLVYTYKTMTKNIIRTRRTALLTYLLDNCSQNSSILKTKPFRYIFIIADVKTHRVAWSSVSPTKTKQSPCLRSSEEISFNVCVPDIPLCACHRKWIVRRLVNDDNDDRPELFLV